MNKKISTSAQLSRQLAAVLALPPVKAGMRLLPERELGQRLGLSLKCVHRALEILTDEGVLSKRQGSGNYVRKIPADVDSVASVLAVTDVFPASELQADEPSRLTSLPDQQRLRLQFWSGFHLPGSDNSFLWTRARDHVALAGHELLPRSVYAAGGNVLTAQEMAEQLRLDPADGYLVSAPVAEVFQEACRLAFGDAVPRGVFLSLWSHNFRVEPSVMQDGVNAICRAIQCFAGQGICKIAFLGYDTRYHAGEVDYLAYDFAMRLQHLDYRCGMTVPWVPDAAAQAMTSMLEQPDPPEAIFVADDHMLAEVDAVLKRKKRRLGQDFAGITICNKNPGLELSHDWTGIEMDRDLLGPLAVDALLKALLVAGSEIRSIALLGTWRFRQSHLLRRSENN